MSQSPVTVLRDEVARAAELWANKEFAHAKSLGAGGPGLEAVVNEAESKFRHALLALAATQPERSEGMPAGKSVGVLVRAMLGKEADYPVRAKLCSGEHEAGHIAKQWHSQFGGHGHPLTIFVDRAFVAPAAPVQHDASELPPLPEWSKMDNLGGLVPSEIRTELKKYARAALASEARADAAPVGDAKIIPEGYVFTTVKLSPKMRDYLQDRLHSPVCKADAVWKHLLKMALDMENE